MKKISKKTSGRIAAVILAVVAAFTVMGCSVEKTVTVTETHTESEDTAVVEEVSEDIATDENVASESETADDVDEELGENPGSFDMGSWSISYDTEKWYGYIDYDGYVVINNLGAVAGSSYLEIKEVDIATAAEAVAMLEEKKGKELIVSDDIQLRDEYSCFAYAEDEVYTSGLYLADFYTIYEHNGKVIIVDEVITHDDDDARAEALAEEFVEVKNTIEFK